MNTRNDKHASTFIVFALLLVFLLPGCGNKEPTGTAPEPLSSEKEMIPLKMGFRPTVVVDLALLQAVSRGDFKKAGLDVSLQPFGRADLLFTALKSGDIQGSAGVPLEPLLDLAAGGKYPYRAYLVWYFDAVTKYDGLLVKADSGINSLDDLKGKIVGSHPSRQVANFVSRFLPESQVRPYNPATPLLSVESGDQAAAYVLEPNITLALALGKYRLLEQSMISRRVFDGARVPAAVSVLSASWVEAHPDAATIFVQVAREAYLADRRQRDTNAVVRILAEKEFGGYSAEIAARVAEPASSLPEEMDRNQLRAFFDALKQGKLLEGTVDVDQLLYVPAKK